MRGKITLSIVVLMLCPAAAFAVTGVSIGARLGYAEYSGDILPGSGDIGGNPTYSVLMGFGAVPALDLELRASYFTKDFDYQYLVGGVPVTASFEYRDLGLTALAKKNVIGAPGMPFAVYAGAGLGWHWINTELAKDLAAGTVGPAQADDPVGLFQNNAKMGGEAVAGVKLSLPAFPLSAFGEVKYGVVFSSERLTVTEYAGGLMIRF